MNAWRLRGFSIDFLAYALPSELPEHRERYGLAGSRATGYRETTA